jgi:hypothetical protein
LQFLVTLAAARFFGIRERRAWMAEYFNHARIAQQRSRLLRIRLLHNRLDIKYARRRAEICASKSRTGTPREGFAHQSSRPHIAANSADAGDSNPGYAESGQHARDRGTDDGQLVQMLVPVNMRDADPCIVDHGNLG